MDKHDPEHLELIEALLNLASLAAELQVTDDGHAAILAICDRVAEHYGIARIDLDEDEPEIVEGAPPEDPNTVSLAFTPQTAPRISFRKPST